MWWVNSLMTKLEMGKNDIDFIPVELEKGFVQDNFNINYLQVMQK